MGACRFCGKSAGLLCKEPKACADAHNEGLERIGKVCKDAALYWVDVDRLTDSVRSALAGSGRTQAGAADLWCAACVGQVCPIPPYPSFLLHLTQIRCDPSRPVLRIRDHHVRRAD